MPCPVWCNQSAGVSSAGSRFQGHTVSCLLSDVDDISLIPFAELLVYPGDPLQFLLEKLVLVLLPLELSGVFILCHIRHISHLWVFFLLPSGVNSYTRGKLLCRKASCPSSTSLAFALFPCLYCWIFFATLSSSHLSLGQVHFTLLFWEELTCKGSEVLW